MIRLVLAAALVATAAPALAQAVPDGYRETLAPAGKTPIRFYAPLAKPRCTAGGPMRQVGKLPITGMVSAGDCRELLAAEDQATRRD